MTDAKSPARAEPESEQESPSEAGTPVEAPDRSPRRWLPYSVATVVVSAVLFLVRHHVPLVGHAFPQAVIATAGAAALVHVLVNVYAGGSGLARKAGRWVEE